MLNEPPEKFLAKSTLELLPLVLAEKLSSAIHFKTEWCLAGRTSILSKWVPPFLTVSISLSSGVHGLKRLSSLILIFSSILFQSIESRFNSLLDCKLFFSQSSD